MTTHTHEFCVDAACECGVMISEYVRELREGAYGKWCAKLTQQNAALQGKIIDLEEHIAILRANSDALRAKLERVSQIAGQYSGRVGRAMLDDMAEIRRLAVIEDKERPA